MTLGSRVSGALAPMRFATNSVSHGFRHVDSTSNKGSPDEVILSHVHCVTSSRPQDAKRPLDEVTRSIMLDLLVIHIATRPSGAR